MKTWTLTLSLLFFFAPLSYAKSSRHYISFGLATTSIIDKSNETLYIGPWITYNYLLTPYWGIGATVEAFINPAIGGTQSAGSIAQIQASYELNYKFFVNHFTLGLGASVIQNRYNSALSPEFSHLKYSTTKYYPTLQLGMKQYLFFGSDFFTGLTFGQSLLLGPWTGFKLEMGIPIRF
jgi:hypothetical protein